VNVFALVRETVALRRAYDCTHSWVKATETEEQCAHCGVIATAEGKANLRAMTVSWHRRRGTTPPPEAG
jgi:hypothetical protein